MIRMTHNQREIISGLFLPKRKKWYKYDYERKKKEFYQKEKNDINMTIKEKKKEFLN